MSKSFGLAGWRLGYLVYPLVLHPALRSLQDTIPTHAAIVSQVVGKAALEKGSEVGREGKEGREGEEKNNNKSHNSDKQKHMSNSFTPLSLYKVGQNPSPRSHTLSRANVVPPLQALPCNRSHPGRLLLPRAVTHSGG